MATIYTGPTFVIEWNVSNVLQVRSTTFSVLQFVSITYAPTTCTSPSTPCTLATVFRYLGAIGDTLGATITNASGAPAVVQVAAPGSTSANTLTSVQPTWVFHCAMTGSATINCQQMH
jgi:hypothetical protein